MARLKPSLPKGTRDFLPEQMLRRRFVIDTIRTIFERYGYGPLETPSIEKLDVLSGKYGEEGEQLIFKVLKRGTGLEELLSRRDEFVVREYSELVDEALRYDLTVPLSRVIAMYQHEITFPFKRYQIQPVWRADRPQRGRFREFYQCDVDTVGSESMLADAEAIAIVNEVLTTLGFENFTIRINNRKILNGILSHADIDAEKSVAVMIAMDKLDKIGIDGVEKELQQRGLQETEIQALFRVLEIGRDPEHALSELSSLSDAAELQTGTDELSEIIKYLRDFNIPASNYKIDLFLVRGLGYYTGPIFESVVEEPSVGSLSGGGRYDQLIGMFLGRDIPATGTSFGIERIIEVMQQLEMLPPTKTQITVLVTLFDETTQGASLKFAQALRKSSINTDVFLRTAKLKKQFAYADKKSIPFVVIIGPEEAANETVTIKDMSCGEQKNWRWQEGINFLKSQNSA